jgi:hypothetical protein
MSDSDSDSVTSSNFIVPDGEVEETDDEQSLDDASSERSVDSTETDILIHKPMYLKLLAVADQKVEQAEERATKAEKELAALRKIRKIPDSFTGKHAKLCELLDEITDDDSKNTARELLYKLFRSVVMERATVAVAPDAAPPASCSS